MDFPKAQIYGNKFLYSQIPYVLFSKTAQNILGINHILSPTLEKKKSHTIHIAQILLWCAALHDSKRWLEKNPSCLSLFLKQDDLGQYWKIWIHSKVTY